MSLPPKLAAAIDELRSLGDRDAISEALIDTAARFVEVAPEVAARPFPEAHRVPACESEAYVWVTRDGEGGIVTHFAVENPQGVSAKALAVLLKESLDGARPEELATLSPELIYDIFGRGVAMGRGLGLTGIVSLLKSLVR